MRLDRAVEAAVLANKDIRSAILLGEESHRGLPRPADWSDAPLAAALAGTALAGDAGAPTGTRGHSPFSRSHG